MESEKKIFEMLDDRHPMAKYWLPLTWATNIINRARKESMIPSDHLVQTLLTEMSDMRWRLGSLIGYDNVTVPLVYTQVRWYISNLVFRYRTFTGKYFLLRLCSPFLIFFFFFFLRHDHLHLHTYLHGAITCAYLLT